MPSNKKKNRQKKKGGGGAAASASAASGDGTDHNTQVLAALTRLAATLARLNEARPAADAGARTSAEGDAATEAPPSRDDDAGATPAAAARDADGRGAGTAADAAAAASDAGRRDSTEEAGAGGDAGGGAARDAPTSATAAAAPKNARPTPTALPLTNGAGMSAEDGAVSDKGERDLMEKVGALQLEDGAGGGGDAAGDVVNDAPTAVTTPETPLPTPAALSLSHWRTLPLHVSSAYQLLSDGASYIHATATKYTLVGKVDSKEGGHLALELRKGAELVGTGTLLLFSASCGSSRSLRRYVKLASRAVLASVISLVQAFEDGLAQGQANDGNNLGAQKTGAVWSACDHLTKKLPRGNRSAMRRELLVWARDCSESVEEFEEVLSLGPRDDRGGGDDSEEEGEDDTMDEEQYTEKEMRVARSGVNVMKCSRNLLGLALQACECVGERADELWRGEELDSPDETKDTAGDRARDKRGSVPPRQAQSPTERRRREMLRWIGDLHEKARAVGEGATDVGVLLYPPLDATRDDDDAGSRERSRLATRTPSGEERAAPRRLDATSLGRQFERQLRALSSCAAGVREATSSAGECLSQEVVDAAEKLGRAVEVRRREADEALREWDR